MNERGSGREEPYRSDESELHRSRRETRAAFENRAHIYRHLLDVLDAELGSERAEELVSRAIRCRGLETGEKYAEALATGGLEAVGNLFCEGSPCGGVLFRPSVAEHEGDERIVLRMEACPLVDAWEIAGLSPEEVDRLCRVAAAVDEGTFERAGLQLTFLERRGVPGHERCLLELRIPQRHSRER